MDKNKLSLILFLITVTCSSGGPTAFTRNGYVEGSWRKSYNGRWFSAFEGIPYAQPPIGDLRFEPPRESSSWYGIRRANIRSVCLQGSSIFWNSTTPVGSEDCLHINVYVPRRMPNPYSNLNVMVHFHASAFMYGSAHHYAGPEYIMDRELILVTLNYRLGAFGFLSTEDEVVPGNNGMKDQVLSLKWIQNNIRFFGGNPDSVTISGSSAGGTSAHLHYFSPLSKGLFHRGFSEGGTALTPYAIQEGALEKAKRLAALLDCPIRTTKALINCLKQKPGNDIAEISKALSPVEDFLPFPFTPVIEKQRPGAFLTRHPYEMLINKVVADVPWLLGVAEEQGSWFSLVLENIIPNLKNDFKRIAPDLLDYQYTISDADKLSTAAKIEEYYFKNSSYTFENLAKLMGDRLFVAAADTAAKLQARANKAPVYFFLLEYKFEHSFAELFGLDGDNIGPSLGDDVFCYLNTPVSSKVLTEGDAQLKSICLGVLASYGDNRRPTIPGVRWNPVVGNQWLQYLSVPSGSEVSMQAIRDLGSNRFWSTLPLQENQNLL